MFDRTGGIDPQAEATDCVCRAENSSRFLFQLLRSLGCSLERVCMCVYASVCKRERVRVREREEERELPALWISLYQVLPLICMLLQPPLSLPLSPFSERCSPPSFPHSLSLPRSLAHFPMSTSCLYLFSGCRSSPCSLYIYLAHSADNSHHNSTSFFVCKKLPSTHTHHAKCMYAAVSICTRVCLYVFVWCAVV